MDISTKAYAVSAFCRRHLTATLVALTTFTLLMVFTVTVFWYTMTNALGNYLNQQTEVLGSSLATQAAFNATQSILTNDLLSLNVLLTRLVVDDNILSARVYNKQDELLAEASSDNRGQSLSDSELRPSEDRRVFSSSIKFRNEIVGHVLITLDRTPAQNTLTHLNNLLIGVAIFICACSFLLVLLVIRWLFAPITIATDALAALAKGHKDATLSEGFYREASELLTHTAEVQKLDWSVQPEAEPLYEPAPPKPQIEMDFERMLEEESQRSCVLFFEILRLEEWHKELPPLQVANLLTPVYRALFQASQQYLGQVHQYKGDSAVVFFRAKDCDDNLYINAVCTAQLFLGVMQRLMDSELYQSVPKIGFHLGLHQGSQAVTDMMSEGQFLPEELSGILDIAEHLCHQSDEDNLVISEDIFTLPDIQMRVHTGLPEVIATDDGNELMSYRVKGIADKYNVRIQEQIQTISRTFLGDEEEDDEPEDENDVSQPMEAVSSEPEEGAFNQH